MNEEKTTINESSLSCPIPVSGHKTIQLAHGSGGLLSRELMTEVFLPAFDNEILNRLDDQAELFIESNRLSFTTDSYVVNPIFFPGGNIGDLAVNGTINDLATSGARPRWLSAGFILEEGFPIDDLKLIVDSMADAARRSGVSIVTGDTKVVNRGKGDGIYINTAGIGVIEHNLQISVDNLQVGDKLILSGTIADHGMCILSKREGLAFESDIRSDTAPLHELVDSLISAVGGAVHALRDPTRGGVAATLNEFAKGSQVGIIINEAKIPVHRSVRGACELLGIDPLHVANEGKLIAAVAESAVSDALAAMRNHPIGCEACVIGEVTANRPGSVIAETVLGSQRIVTLPVGEQLPRIC
jgi:hydrogenase expression/formation protein HypE